jgi:hypothetical protein
LKASVPRPTGSHRQIPRKLRVYRAVGIVAALVLGALAVYGRCQQMDRARASAIESGLNALARAIERGDGDYDEAEQVFHAAAAEGLRDPYPRFCLSAIRELRGEQPVLQAPPDGWVEAVALIAAGRFAEGRAAFQRFREVERPYSSRAELYLRLIGDLEAAPAREP